MLERIIEASNDYFKQIFENDSSATQTFLSEDFFVSKIKAFSDSISLEVYLFLDKSLVEFVYEFMLFEKAKNLDEIKDFTCEIANLIVGSAKVLAQNDEIPFNISTPIFVSQASDIVSQDYLEVANFQINQKAFSIRTRQI